MFKLFLENLISLSLETLILYILTCGFTNIPLKKYIKKLPYFLLPISCYSLISIYCNSTIVLSVVFICADLSVFYFMMHKPILHLFLLQLINYMLIALFEFLLIALLGMNTNSVFNFYIQCFGTSFLVLISLLAYFLLPLHKVYDLLLHKNTTLYLIITNSFVLTLGIVIFAKIQPENFFYHFFIVFTIIIVLLFINGEVFINHRKQLEKEKQLQAYQTYLPVVEQLIEQVREKQHDYHNHIQTIRSLCYTCTTFDELQAALMDTSEYYIQQTPINNLLKLNLHLLAGFLISKIQQGRAVDKTLHIEVCNFYITTECSEYEIIEYIGILIDNALEAIPRYETVYASLACEHNKLVFKIRNPGPTLTPDFCKKIFSKEYTTKGDGSHGIGLYKLNQYVKEHNGEILLENMKINHQVYLCFQLTL